MRVILLFFFISVFISCKHNGNTDINEELSREEYLANLIDEYAGHPNDPSYPTDLIGPSDEVISQTNSREILTLMNECKKFAFDTVSNEPRFLFALGRAAYIHDYVEIANDWLQLAADNGSAGAKAYLGFMAYDKDDVAEANRYLTQAIKEGFINNSVKEVHRACNFTATDFGFEKPNIINALYNKDWSSLESIAFSSNYILKIHTTLWETDILWLAEDPNFLMELDADLSKKLQSILEKWQKIITDVTLQDAIKDARRLALLYNSNPVAFRRIYSGMKEYMSNKFI